MGLSYMRLPELPAMQNVLKPMRDGLAGKRHAPTNGWQELESGPLICCTERAA